MHPRRTTLSLTSEPAYDDFSPTDRACAAAAVEAGVRPEIIFAIAKTGVFLMKENEHLYSDEDKEEFRAAMEEYRERSKRHDA